MVNAEFNRFRGLFPLKLFVTGPPAAGKTLFCAALAKDYGIPHITVKDAIQLGVSLQNELGQEVRAKIEQVKDEMQELYNKTKKKKDPEFDRENAKWRLPEQMVARLLQLKIQSPACTNKGFILDSYPRTFD